MSMDCELCRDEKALFGDDNAFVRYDNNSLSKGHVLVVPRRHVADFFEMTWAEKTSILALLDRAKADISREHSPDGFNIGKAGGQ
jgi:diadenosine tetraphosphate (Ap4A) HIT family hydrolase